MEQLGAAMNPRGPVELAQGAGRLAGNAINEAMVYGRGPLAGITPQPMRMDVYHGSTNKELTKLDPKKSFGRLGVSWVSPEEEFAKRYAGKEGRVYKLDLNEGKNFDFANQEQLEMLKEKAKSIVIYDPIRGAMTLDKRVPDSGSYYSAEDPQIFNLIKKMGFDSVSVYEDGVRNIGVFNPKKNIKFIDESSNKGLLNPNKPSFTYPQEKAMRLAQQRAALPVEQFGLGLQPNNTAQQRAAAMFPFDVYHGTNADIPVMNVAGKGKTSGAGAFVNDNPLAAETYVNASGGGNIIPMRMSKEGLLSVNAKGRNWADIETNTLAPKAGKKRYSLEDMELSKNDVTSTDELGIIAKDLLGLQGVDIKNVKDLGPNSHIFRAKEYLQDKYGIAPDETWSNVTGKQFQEARDYMDKLYKSQKSTVTAVQDPDLLRSRFAAFDPWRRTAATAAAMGVAAPDLLAQEQPVITQQQIDDEMSKYGLLGR
jgi:hypothetical protein